MTDWIHEAQTALDLLEVELHQASATATRLREALAEAERDAKVHRENARELRRLRRLLESQPPERDLGAALAKRLEG